MRIESSTVVMKVMVESRKMRWNDKYVAYYELYYLLENGAF